MKTTLPVFLLLGCLSTATYAQPSPANRTITIVSVGDSVASGEGNPNTPQKVEANPGFNPVALTSNPHYSPLPKLPNPTYNPIKEVPNLRYNPFRKAINPQYQPFPMPSFLAALLPWFPPYDPNLTISNPAYDDRMFVSNPDYDDRMLVDNPDFDDRLFTDVPNPDFDDMPYVRIADAEWDDDTDDPGAHRSNVAGPALAAAKLRETHPELSITFLSLAHSGASCINYPEVSKQIRTARTTVKDPIDVLMISVGANDVYSGGFSGLILDCLESLGPSTDPAINAAIDTGLAGLPATFKSLADIITNSEDGSCKVNQVFITEYFDPTRGYGGEFSHGEMEWAYNKILVPLNAAVRAAAEEHGWHYVGGVAEQFRNHGYFACRATDPRPVIPNPNYSPLPSLPNPKYNPIEKLPNPNYNPIQNMPNLKYNPIENKPNLDYDPIKDLPNLKYQPFSFLPNYDPRPTIPNPDHDPFLTVPNPAYDSRLTLRNPDYSPALTIPNPDYDPKPTKPNPSYDPRLTVPNPDYELGPVVGENWVVRVEQSLKNQGDWNGTAHPNAAGQAVYRDRLVEEINRFANWWPAPRIAQITISDSAVRLQFENQYPLERIEIQRVLDVAGHDWTTVDCSLAMLENGLYEAAIARTDFQNEFFRVAVK